jgi:O-antigen/teichoic acid export membrane protein
MGSPVFWRRSSTAAGVYLAAALGFIGTVVAVRELGVYDFGLLSLVLAAAGFFQLFADLTVEEAVVKYGFRYQAREDWGRFRRVFQLGLRLKLAGGLLGAAAVALLAPLSHAIWTGGLVFPLLLAALLPLAQAPEGVASAALIVRRRYDLRAAFLVVSMALRLAALAVGGLFGVVETVLALVVAQVLATAAIGAAGALALRRFPRAAPQPLAEDRLPFRRFVVQSSIGSVLSPMRGLLGTLLLGTVAGPHQVAYLRIAQVPETAFATLTSPARMILLTEQTDDFERGRSDRVYATLRRYMLAAAAVTAVLLPPLAIFMPDLLRIAYGANATPATGAARLFLLVAAIQVIWGWAKSFPVSIGRPALRLLAQGTEIAVLVPALLVLGAADGARGAAGAFLLAAVAFAGVWVVLMLRLRRERRSPATEVAPEGEPVIELRRR